MRPRMRGAANDVLAVLSHGPATAYQVAVELDSDVQRASALLSHWHRMGAVETTGEKIKTGGRPAQVWRIAA